MRIITGSFKTTLSAASDEDVSMSLSANSPTVLRQLKPFDPLSNLLDCEHPAGPLFD
jgi:hypothetical protein